MGNIRRKIRADYSVLRTTDLGPRNDDGERFTIVVWDVEVMTVDGEKWIFHIAFNSEEEAHKFGKTVVRYGSIDPELWACWTNTDELPDYVAYPEHPAFN